MRRLLFQADEELLERARRRAHERGISLAQLVRDALEHELGDEGPPPPLTCIGVAASGDGDLSERAADDEYEPEPWRSS